jgi:hypothetical protein
MVVDGSRQQNFKPNTYFRGPKEGQQKRVTGPLVLHKDHNERLNESKLVNNNKRDGSLRQPCLLRDVLKNS